MACLRRSREPNRTRHRRRRYLRKPTTPTKRTSAAISRRASPDPPILNEEKGSLSRPFPFLAGVQSRGRSVEVVHRRSSHQRKPMRRTYSLLLAVAATLPLAGCYYDPGYVRSSSGGDAYYGTETTTVVQPGGAYYDPGYGYYGPGYYGGGYSTIAVYGGGYDRRYYRDRDGHDHPRQPPPGGWHDRPGDGDHRPPGGWQGGNHQRPPGGWQGGDRDRQPPPGGWHGGRSPPPGGGQAGNRPSPPAGGQVGNRPSRPASSSGSRSPPRGNFNRGGGNRDSGN